MAVCPGTQQRVRLLHEIMSLALLGADVEQTDAGPRRVVHVARDDRAHDGELLELMCRRPHVGAEIENVGVTRGIGHGGHDRRALDLGETLEHEVRDRRERTRIARADRGIGVALLHEIDGDAHRGVFLAPNGLARRVGHQDDFARRNDFEPATQRSRGRCRAQQGFEGLGLADELELEQRIVLQGAERRGHALLRAQVAAHDIERDDGHSEDAPARGAGGLARPPRAISLRLLRQPASRSRACRDRNHRA